jgi:hypothetical protein
MARVRLRLAGTPGVPGAMRVPCGGRGPRWRYVVAGSRARHGAGYPPASSAKCAASPPAGTEACSPEVMSLTVTVPASSSVFP